MKGKYRITLQDKNSTVKYELEVSRQITIVCGDSGIGKTLLHKLVEKYCNIGELSNLNLKVDSDYVSVEPFTPQLIRVDNSGFLFKDKTRKLRWLSKPKNVIYLVDEDILAIKGINFASLIRYTDAYYVIFTREARAFRYLYNSVWDVLTIKDDGGEAINNKCRKLYEEFNGNIKEYDEVIHEDSTTGKEVCAKALSEVVESVYGNINIVQNVEERPRSTILMIADGANFSNILSEIIDTSEECLNTVYLLLPESTEYVLLHNKLFSTDSNVIDSINNPSLACDTTKYTSYERMYEDIITLAHINSPNKIPEYEKKKDLEAYKTESFIDTYRAILTRIDGIKSSYNVKYSLYKIENGKLMVGDLHSSKINELDKENEK